MSNEFKDEVTGVGRGSNDAWARAATGTGVRRVIVLVGIAGPRAGRRYRLGRECVIGRQPGCTIQLPGTEVSRRHARIGVSPDGELLLEDLGSRNGTLVNGVRTDRQVLRAGDLIQIGDENAFMFLQHSALEDLILQEQRLDAVARVTGGLAHEFNNLLAVVLAELQYLREGLEGEELSEQEMLESMKAADAAARRAARLSQQVLSFGRRGQARESRPVDLQNLAEEVATLLRPSFSSTVLRVEIPADLTVVGDAGLLHQALLNLCLQACEELSEGGAVAIRAEAPDPVDQPGPFGEDAYVLITVQDTGPGHDDETRQRLFQPLFGAGRSRGALPGLAAVYDAVREHGGKIEVETAPGWGTSFRIFLPLREASPHQTTTHPTSPAVRAVSRTVLLVEDVESERSFASRLLEEMGLRVLTARDGREAIRLYTANQAQLELVVLDVILPNLSGKETFRWLRRLDPQVKVLLTSGYLDAERLRDLLDSGTCWFMPKPYEAAKLRAAVVLALGAEKSATP